MIEVRYGDVLKVERGIIVHGCNTQGAMGAGIALTIKNRFPHVYQAYKEYEKTHGLKLGSAHAVKIDEDKWIVNAITQHLPTYRLGVSGRLASYDAIASCFEKVVEFADEFEKDSGKSIEIVFPKIGAGLGGANWDIIEAIIDNTVPDRFKKSVYIYP